MTLRFSYLARSQIETPAFSFDFVCELDGILAKTLVPVGEEVHQGHAIALLVHSPAQLEAFRENEKKKIASLPGVAQATAAVLADSDLAGERAEVTDWLHSLSGDVERYASVMFDDGFDSLRSVSTITEEDLKRLGVKTGHRRVLLSAIAALAERFKPAV